MKTKRKLQQGFTAVELMVVVVVLGLLAAWLVPKIFGLEDRTKAKVMISTATDIKNALDTASRACQVSAVATGNLLPDSGKTIQDVLFGGTANVATGNKTCYADSGVRALTDVSQPTAAAGAYNIEGYAVELTGGGSVPLQVVYKQVPSQIVRQMAKQFNSKLDDLAASDSTSAVLQYTAAVNDMRDVTVIRQ